MDVDAAGLPFLKIWTPCRQEVCGRADSDHRPDGQTIYRKRHYDGEGCSESEAAGAAGIVVSNHGGRVLDQCPATAEVLSEIADAVNGTMKVIVDGESALV